MDFPEGVVLFDSLGDIKTDNTCPVLVCASHCGDNGTFAKKLSNCHVRAVFLNNAGIGKNQAGISGLSFYAAAGILACAVDHNSAESGVARDTLDNGIISHTNDIALEAGILPGETVREAIAKIIHLYNQPQSLQFNTKVETQGDVNDSKIDKCNTVKQFRTQIAGVSITVADSITFLNESNAGDIVVCGSHGGVSAGHYAQKHHLKAVFFNDAGIGKNNAGIKSLDSLSDAGILACTVDCMSAEIFNGQDTLENGVISVCNQLAKDSNIHVKMTVREAIKNIHS